MSKFSFLETKTFFGGAEKVRKVIDDMRAIGASPVEREFEQRRGLEIKTRTFNGHAVSFYWSTVDVPQNGQIIRMRVNGQHSSWALSELLKENALPNNIVIHLDRYTATDEGGVVLLFRQLDSRMSVRTVEDISGAYQCFHPELKECKRSTLMTAAKGVNWYRREVESTRYQTGDEVFTLFDEKRLHPFFIMVDDIMKNGKSKELNQIPVMAAIYGTWLDDSRVADEFWKLVSLGTNRSVEDAASDLDEELTQIPADKSDTRPGVKYAKCAKAWHAYGDGIRVKSFKVNTTKGLPSLGGFDS